MSPILQLPICLLVEIFDLLHPKEPFQPRDLSAFCRTCKAAHELGTPWLYRHYEYTGRLGEFRKLKLFCSSLKNRHSLGTHTTSLELSMPHPRDVDIEAKDNELPSSLIESLHRRGFLKDAKVTKDLHILAAWFDMAYGLMLTETRRLKRLSLYYSAEANFMECNMGDNVKRTALLPSPPLPQRRQLQLEEVSFTQHFWARHGSFSISYLFFEWVSFTAPSLKRLSFNVGVWNPKNGLPQPELVFQSLTHLNLGNSCIPSEPLKFLLSSCKALVSFQHMPMGCPFAHFDDVRKNAIRPAQPNHALEALRPTRESLQHLELVMMGAKMPYGPKSIRERMVSMDMFERLTHLTLDTCCYHAEDSLSELLPPNLESFQLIGMHRTMHDELKDLADTMSRLRLPYLRTVTLYPWPCAALSCTDITKLSGITDSFRQKGVAFSCSPIHTQLQLGELNKWIKRELDVYFADSDFVSRNWLLNHWDDFWNDRGWGFDTEDE